jgi:hypothetical protein
LSYPTYAGTEKAIAALNRANEYRDAGALLYEPRFLDVEKATEELAASATKPADTLVATIANTCVVELKSYREILDNYGVLLAKNHRSPALDKLVKETVALRDKRAVETDACIAKMQSYLQ